MTFAGGDRAVAWSFAIIVLMVICTVFMWIVCTPLINQLTETMNDRIEDGRVTQQTKTTFGFLVTLFTFFPAFALGAIALYSIVRSLYEQRFPG